MLSIPLQDSGPVTPQRIAAATETVRRCGEAWETFGRRVVSDAEIQDADTQVSDARNLLTWLDSSEYRKARAKLITFQRINRLGRLIGQEPLGWPLASFMFATTTCGVVAPLLIVCRLDLPSVLLGCCLSFIAVGTSSAVYLRHLATCNPNLSDDELREWLAKRELEIREALSQVEEWQGYLRQLVTIRNAQSAYEKKAQELEQLRALAANRRYQLLHTDWRSLRGVPFENFLADVVTELGFVVGTTKASGDQGVDLILEGRGQRIAVQAKGYKDAVGNSAIQEVMAGMVYYECNLCVTVTNSTFTPAARELAQKAHCILIDGSRISDLIEGRIL